MSHNYKNRKKVEKNEPDKKKIAGIVIAVFVVLLVVLFIALPKGNLFTSATKSNEEATTTSTSETEKTVNTGEGELMSGKVNATIDIKDYGTIKVELDADAAPITVTNFVKLANEGFYDGLTFHRIIDGFMMQGGDPEGTGMGGSDENIKGEFSNNGVENNLSHTRGAISMARNGIDMDSASSQFFICHQDALFLDGDYACFGYVTDGMDVVDKVCTSMNPTDDNGSIAPAEQPVINSIKIG